MHDLPIGIAGYTSTERKKEKEIRKGTIEYVISPLETKKMEFVVIII